MKLEENKKHLITMNKAEDNFCDIDGLNTNIRIDSRGKKQKFWLMMPYIDDGEITERPEYLLKYEERQNDSLDNVGQFLVCGVLDQLGVPHAKYLPCEFKLDGEYYDAILSENYRTSPNDIELSGFTLNMKNKDRYRDNFFGEYQPQCHTVNFYTKVLKDLYGKNKVDFEAIRERLLEYSLVQYVFMMSDLHFYNLSFSYDETQGHKSMKVVPFYDCGNICCMSLSRKKVQNIYEQFNHTRKPSVFLDNLYYKKMPMFGLETDISSIYREKEKDHYICRPLCSTFETEEEQLASAKDSLDIFRFELAEEIRNNPTFAQFYRDIKTKVNIKEIADKYNAIKEDMIPEYCVGLTEMTMENSIKALDKVIKKRNAFDYVEKNYDKEIGK